MEGRRWTSLAAVGMCALVVAGCGADDPITADDKSPPTARERVSEEAGVSAPGTSEKKSPTRPRRIVFAPIQGGVGNDFPSLDLMRPYLEADIRYACGGDLCLNIVTQVVPGNHPEVPYCYIVSISPKPTEGLVVDSGSTVLLQISGKNCEGSGSESPPSSTGVTRSVPSTPPTLTSEVPIAPTESYPDAKPSK